jgi:ribosomal protein L6P/L9E
MSRIGKLPISIPAGVEVKISDQNVITVKGPKGSLEQQVDPDITLKLEDGTLSLERPTDQKRHKAMHGLYRSLVSNMVQGVSEEFKIVQMLVGVGFKAQATGQVLELALGYSHNIVFVLPDEVKVETGYADSKEISERFYNNDGDEFKRGCNLRVGFSTLFSGKRFSAFLKPELRVDKEAPESYFRKAYGVFSWHNLNLWNT